MKALVKTQVLGQTANWRGRLVRAASVAVGTLASITLAADQARGAPIPWGELPAVLGPTVALTLAGTVLAAWMTTDTGTQQAEASPQE